MSLTKFVFVDPVVIIQSLIPLVLRKLSRRDLYRGPGRLRGLEDRPLGWVVIRRKDASVVGV